MIGKRFRRLAGVLAIALIVQWAAGWSPAVRVNAADEFDALRQKWYDVLTGGSGVDPGDPDAAAQIAGLDDQVSNAGSTGVWDLLRRGTDRSACGCLWTDLSELKSDNIVVNYGRLRTMALAYATEGSRFHRDEALKSDLLGALDWMYANRYNETTVKYGNWYHWEMSGPQQLLDTVILLYEDLSAGQIADYMRAVAAFAPDPNLTNGSTATGANRVEKAWVYMLRAIVVKDGAQLALARDALSDKTGTPTSTAGAQNVFAYNTIPETDGMHKDGSFLQHGPHPYIGNYGTTFFQLVANAMYVLNGSAWQIEDPQAGNVYRWIYDSFAPTMVKGAQMDMVRGRLISNSGVQSHVAGHRVIQGVLTVALFAPEQDALAFKSMAKAWVTEDTYRSFLRNAPLFYSAMAKRIVADSAIPAYTDWVGHKLFTQSDRVVHHRPSFSYGLAMSSARVFRYESINGNNLHGWRTGDGVTYLYNGDLSQYDDDYWATVDKYRLPGITTDVRTLGNAAGQSTKTPHGWVGGASDGTYGVVGMQFTPYGSKLTGKKSWFLFDKEIVALGAGITSMDANPVETVVENRKLADPAANVLTVDGAEQPAGMTSAPADYTGARWAHLAGAAPGSDIGYYFPEGGALKGLREARTATWGDSQGGVPTEPITRNYQTLWLDHGSKPVGGTYQYAVLPNRSRIETEQYAAAAPFQVLDNSEDAQAVRQAELGVVGANFWNDADKTVYADGKPWLTSRSKASAMTRLQGDELELYAADPTQTRTEPIELELHTEAVGVIAVDPGVSVRQLSPTVRLTIDARGAAGGTKSVRLRLTNPAGDVTPPSAPDRLSAAALSRSALKLQWAASADDTAVAGYEVYRDGEKVADVRSPDYIDASLASGVTYTYTVVAYDPSGNRSAASAPVSAATLGGSLYLIEDRFDGLEIGSVPPDYTITTAGGTVSVEGVKSASDRSLKLEDTNSGKEVVVSKPFGLQGGPLLIEFDVMFPQKQNYHAWIVKGDNNANAVTITTAGGNFAYKNASNGDVVLMPYSANTWYTFQLIADPATKRVTIAINGTVYANGVPFRTAVSSLNQFVATTGSAGVGTHYVDNVVAYPFLPFLEDSFDTEPLGAAPGGYEIGQGGGRVAIAAVAGTPGKSVRLEPAGDGRAAEAIKRFPAQREAVAARFDVLLPEAADGHRWSLLDEAGSPSVTVSTYGGRLVATDGDGRRIDLGGYRPGTWHEIKMVADVTARNAAFVVDGVASAVDVPLAGSFGALSGFSAAAEGNAGAAHYIDKVSVFPFRYLINDTYERSAIGTVPPAYTIDPGASGNSVRVAQGPDGEGRSLYFTDSTNKAAVATKTFPTQTGPVVAEFDIWLPNKEAYHSWNMKDDAGTNGISILTSQIGGEDVFTYKNAAGGDTVIQPYEPGRRYRFKLVADPGAGKYTIYVDGAPKAVDVPFRYGVSHFGKFAASTATGGTGSFHVDNLKVYPLGLLQTELPVVTLEGESELVWPLGKPFADPGYTASSEYYGDVTGRVTVEGSVDVDTAGDYELRYRASDPLGRSGKEAVRRVRVADKLQAAEAGLTPEVGGDGAEFVLRAKVWHAEGERVEVSSSIGGVGKSVVLERSPTEKPAFANAALVWSGAELPEGRYEPAIVTARGEDGTRASVSAAAGVTVDKTAPALAMTLLREDGAPYVPGETADKAVTVTANVYDAFDGASAVSYRLNDSAWTAYTEPLRLADTGSYTVRLQAVDRAGNRSPTVTAAVYVRREAPVLSLLGDNPVTVPLYGTYREPGYIATSPAYGDISDRVTVSGAVYADREGTYTLVYRVSDPAGLAAEQKERIVIVTAGDPDQGSGEDGGERIPSVPGGESGRPRTDGVAGEPHVIVGGRPLPVRDPFDAASGITISVPAAAGPYTVELPAETLALWHEAERTAYVTISTEGGDYSLPLQELLSFAGTEGSVRIEAGPVPEREMTALRLAAERDGLRLAGEAWSYRVEVVADGGGAHTEIERFRDFVLRTIRHPDTVGAIRAGRIPGVARFDPASGTWTPVPASVVTDGGEYGLTFRSNGNSVYVPIEANVTFADMEGHWAKSGVERLAVQGMVRGSAPDRFDPDRSVTRAEWLTMLVRGLGLLNRAEERPFADTPLGDWYADAVAAGTAYGIVGGYPDGTFGPNRIVSRQEAAVMLYRALTAAGISFPQRSGDGASAGRFADAGEIGGFAAEAVDVLTTDGMLQGVGEAVFAPLQPATRAQAAVLLQRLLDRIASGEA
ncbi:polysaccharide lyase family 8 super-sandwich domain-containing protein [Paenibacillus flagellatus]|uniref:polysaccharide lyase family 8 super-sandwich domain-containing protein n=1 Tax=Paenibacillus flagellatus TaxID=2211139 RepID=UPI0011B52B3C|nr:polysaccharide lyase family 8 super-sandwich domain-containing protein [Paenibacillus flagellatus]